MWDGVANAEVTRLAESAHAAGGVVAAVGHGTAALLDATGADGKPIIAGRQVGRHGLGKTGTRREAAGGVSQPVSLDVCSYFISTHECVKTAAARVLNLETGWCTPGEPGSMQWPQARQWLAQPRRASQRCLHIRRRRACCLGVCSASASAQMRRR